MLPRVRNLRLRTAISQFLISNFFRTDLMKQLMSTNLGQLTYAKHLEWKKDLAAEAMNPGTTWTGEYPPSSILGPYLRNLNSGEPP